MSKVVIKVRVLPESVDTDLNKLVEDIKRAVRGLAEISSHRREPIAFGLNALLIDFIVEDREGVSYELESTLQSVNGVSQFDVLGVSRLSTKL